jgi:molybdopterin-containing oxidoreductase family iron-sulfur binding subunit
MLEELNVKPRTLYLARVRNVPKELMTDYQLDPKRPTHDEHGGSGAGDSAGGAGAPGDQKDRDH